MLFKFSMPNKSVIILLCLVSLLLLNSCYSYKIYPKEYRNARNTHVRETVYVVNDTLKKEFKILEKSNLFTFTKDSTQTNIKIKLYPIKQYPGCGNPLIAQVITLGQLPVYLPNQYEYQFDRIEKGKTNPQKFNLGITQRYWFWDMFTFSKNFEKKAGQLLLVKYQDKQN
ncbi:hypothetical protein AAFH68_40330 [Flavobacterium sp. CGRL1]